MPSQEFKRKYCFEHKTETLPSFSVYLTTPNTARFVQFQGKYGSYIFLERCQGISSHVFNSAHKVLCIHIKPWQNFHQTESTFFGWGACCAACGNIVPSLSGIKPEPLAVKAWSPNYWPNREFPTFFFFLIFVEWMIQESICPLKTRLIFSRKNTFLKMDSFSLRCSQLTGVEQGMFRGWWILHERCYRAGLNDLWPLGQIQPSTHKLRMVFTFLHDW